MRHICGIALINPNEQPCMITAFMSIYICKSISHRMDCLREYSYSFQVEVASPIGLNRSVCLVY